MLPEPRRDALLVKPVRAWKLDRSTITLSKESQADRTVPLLAARFAWDVAFCGQTRRVGERSDESACGLMLCPLSVGAEIWVVGSHLTSAPFGAMLVLVHSDGIWVDFGSKGRLHATGLLLRTLW